MIEQTTVDGVQTVFSYHPGPTVAGLSFRVGTADETLPRRGITHMVEHLALHRVGLGDYHANGQTGPSVTMFHVSAGNSRVRDFLEIVCSSLGDLPVERLALERSVIATEEAGRGASEMRLWRHGAVGYGSASYPEFGIRSLTAEHAQAWAHEWFTADNAVLWVTGESLPDLSLPLPRGSRKPLPAITSALPELPAYFSSGRRQIAFDTMVVRSSAARVFAGVLERRLYDTLRVESGISYQVQVGYEPYSADLAAIAGSCDALEDSEGALVGQFIDTIAAIGAEQYDEALVETVKTRSREAMDVPHPDAMRLPGVAQNLLFGSDVRPIDELVAEADEVGIDDVRQVARAALAGMLVKVPVGTSAAGGGYVPAPAWSSTRVDGTSYPSGAEGHGDLVVGPLGLSIEHDGGPATVLYGEVEAVLAWPDGAVQLIGRDGMAVSVEPTLHALGAPTMEWLYNQVPAEKYVEMPARDPEQIPQPTPAAEAPRRSRLRRRRKP